METLRAYNPDEGDLSLDRPTGFYEPSRDPLEFLSKLLTAISSGPPGVTLAATPKRNPITVDTVLRDITQSMGRLLRGNMPPKEPDPRIIRQLGAKQEAGGLHLDLTDPGPNPSLTYANPLPDVKRWVEQHRFPGLGVKPELAENYVDPGISLKSEAWPSRSETGLPSLIRKLKALHQQGLWP